MTVAPATVGGRMEVIRMDDTISRKWLINHLKHRRDAFCKNRTEFLGLSKNDKARVDEMDTCIAEVINAPTIEPEREKGHWIPIDEDSDVYECDVCRTTYDTICGTFDLPYFCPHCGADMRGEQDETD